MVANRNIIDMFILCAVVRCSEVAELPFLLITTHLDPLLVSSYLGH